MKITNITIGIILLYLIATSCSKNSTTSKVFFEKDFSADHSDWIVSGDTIVKQFNIKIADSDEPCKAFWLTSKDPDGCIHVSYARLERIKVDTKIQAKGIKASTVMCGTEWESNDPTLYDQIVFTGNFTESGTVGKKVKQGHFLTIMGNGSLDDLN